MTSQTFDFIPGGAHPPVADYRETDADEIRADLAALNEMDGGTDSAVWSAINTDIHNAEIALAAAERGDVIILRAEDDDGVWYAVWLGQVVHETDATARRERDEDGRWQNVVDRDVDCPGCNVLLLDSDEPINTLVGSVVATAAFGFVATCPACGDQTFVREA